MRAVAISVPGTVSGTTLAQAADLGWHDVDLATLFPGRRDERPLVTGNDATFAAVAESRRGAAVGASTSLHLYMDAAIGGAVVEHGRVLTGASGMAGEFGHMPYGRPGERCTCGADGCWNTTLDAAALARLLGRPAPSEGVSFSRAVVAAARNASPAELAAVRTVARSVARGAAGLVNAFDPDVVTVGGLGRELLAVAGGEIQAAYLAGLMRFRTTPPPPLLAAHFGDDAPLVGASEEAFAAVLDDEGIRSWSRAIRR